MNVQMLMHSSLNSAIKTQYTYVSHHTGNGTNKNPTPPKNLFN